MNIKRAKEEIINTVKAYLSCDENGNYKIAPIRQRPILLMGPPGIGKTQIMEQVAEECNVALVAYTITHHTRQSAVGLPFIEKKKYGDKNYSVTDYSMSEIIASVYEKQERTRLTSGILFIDEINCVSETLAPTMLQFLQYKTFGNQKVPDGWIIIAAGNPPEYNKSVREFDAVTLDRVRKVEIEPDFEVFKEYAYKQVIHPSILQYLDIRRENFYRFETTPDGIFFATARGWEDLSEMLAVCEELHIPVDAEFIYEYIQHDRIAKDFANYYELYNKYKKDYRIEEIVLGNYSESLIASLKTAPFDERLNLAGLLLGRLGRSFVEVQNTEKYTEQLYESLKVYLEQLPSSETRPDLLLKEIIENEEAELTHKKQEGLINRKEESSKRKSLATLKKYQEVLRTESGNTSMAYDTVKRLFGEEKEARKKGIEKTSGELDNAFLFMEKSFGEGQEMVIFVTELSINYYSARFIAEHGCKKYYEYNKNLLFDERREEIIRNIEM
ncbi:ATP-binding protein [Anaerocolumna xylanovorans]|uniref:AAA domain (Dynein-related subfamily) n=1 Tax=Anaerocolumna xylanovorans DSM 12503 TaxID=1121345 RepID=A0A1M7Y1A8_9FIRM|nr:AAA family ATPase [Anaerocolumna xylanovorans]SHO45561.1 AAA domain (dynein-related subfamily) [Anaerocolumna xylanovorans DSM 12503]